MSTTFLGRMSREDTRLEIADIHGTLEIAHALINRALQWGELTDDERSRLTDASNETGRAWHRVSGKPLAVSLPDGTEAPLL